MSDKITHECTISWGMLWGDNTGEYVENLIKDKKLEVALALERAGFKIIDQHFIHDVEWGTLITWAELVENPQNISMSIGNRQCKFGYFYDGEKQRSFLNLYYRHYLTSTQYVLLTPLID